MGCQCFSDTKRNYSGMCKWLTHPTSKKIICSGFYFQSEDGTCTSYQFNQFTRNINNNKDLASAFIQCADGRIIPKDSADHLPVDCQQEGMDELNLINMIQSKNYFHCRVHNQLPCLKGYSECYNISDICTYKLDKNMHLSPCRNGGHLESCKEIDCNMMFKCPNYYCIPWNYVCDGKWDCPRGIDEDLLHGCI